MATFVKSSLLYYVKPIHRTITLWLVSALYMNVAVKTTAASTFIAATQVLKYPFRCEILSPNIGLLDAVGDPRINLVDGTLCLSWTPPFTLDIAGVDPDLYYIIEITSSVDAENPLTVSCNDCSSEYKFTVNNSSPCESFTFIVVPVNGAGNGTLSDPLQGSFIRGRYMYAN